ncbi:MAG: GspH/FimT family pseudopilin [Pseudomonadota bacterium]
MLTLLHSSVHLFTRHASGRWPRAARQQGVTMIELLIVIVIVGIVSVLAAPSVNVMIQNGRIRTIAESVQNGLQLARANAVKRNTTVRFQLTSNLENTCVLSTTSSNWVVSLSDPTGACDPTPAAGMALESVPPSIIQKRSGAEGGAANVTVTADASSRGVIGFSGLGRQIVVTNLDSTTTMSPVQPVSINIQTSPATDCMPVAGAIVAVAGTIRCLRVVVSSYGQIGICDPSKSVGSPQGCPI